jgi:DNA ligase-1
MDDLLHKRPKFGKDRNALLNGIVNRSRKRKPANQNQDQTRKNRNVLQGMMKNMKKSSPDYNGKQSWLSNLDLHLKNQYKNADEYEEPVAPKPKRKFKIAQGALEAASKEALEKTAETLEKKGVKPPSPSKVVEAPKQEEARKVPSPVVTAISVTPKKRVFKIAAEKVVASPAKPPSPKIEKASFPILYNKSKTGKIQLWQIEVTLNKTGSATILTQWGYKDGKLATSEKELTEGKNKGKTNETTPFQQAVSEAQSSWEKKKTREGYAEIVSDAAVPGVAETKAVEQNVLYPMLAQDYTKQSRKIRFPCYVQAKLDGVRSLFRNGVFTSRTAKPFGFLDHIVKELKPAIDAGFILDGEIYSTTLSFQEFVGLVKKKRVTAKDIETLKQVNLWVYDCVNEHPFEKRLAMLIDFFSHHTFKHVHLLPTEECKTKEDIKTFHDKYVEAGYEGLIIRNKAGMYRLSTRSENLQKFKEFEDAEFTIVGFDEGDGNEKGAVIWVCETEDKKQFRVRPKGTIEERKELFKKAKSYVGKKLTVKYQEMTDDGIPRFGIGIAIRDYE